MIKLITLKIKLTLLFIFLLLSVVIGGYFYLNKMSTVSGNLNINKTNPIDRLCNYTVYSDFYYRIVNYKEEEEGSYAELTPVSTTICFDFKSKKIDLQSRVKSKENLILDDNNGNEVESTIQLLDNFKQTYSKIVATQDKDYFDKSYKTANETLLSLYGENNIVLEEVNPQTKYYTSLNNLPINNMMVNYYNLENITSKPIQAEKSTGWKPNILEWKFGEKDRVYLQYFTKLKSNNLDDFIANKYSQLGKTIVKLTKFNNNTLNKIFLILDSKENKIKTLFMDNNGHVYILILQVSNKKAYETYFNDYMKIAYGIYFEKVNGLDNSFHAAQREAIQSYKEYEEEILQLNEFCSASLNIDCKSVINKESSLSLIKQYFDSTEIQNKIKKPKFDIKQNIFKKIYGQYPNKKIIDLFKQNIKDLKRINEENEKSLKDGLLDITGSLMSNFKDSKGEKNEN